MNGPTNIMILDENHFYADGIARYFLKHGYRHEKALNFIHRLEDATGPVLLFTSLQMMKRLPRTLFTEPSSQIRAVCIVGRRILPGGSCPGFPWIPILHRESPASAIPLVLNRRPRAFAPRLTFSPLEIDVLQALMHGTSACVAGKFLHITEKTVSVHKRTAMRKLGLTSNLSLQAWLLSLGQLCVPENKVMQGKSC